MQNGDNRIQIQIDKVLEALVSRAEYLALQGDDASSRIMLIARRTISTLMAKVPPEDTTPPPVPAPDEPRPETPPPEAPPGA